MKLGGKGSGGANKLSLEELQRRGTFRPARHAGLLAVAPPADTLTAADRKRLLSNLPPDARHVATRLLDDYSGWDTASLETLRAYAFSTARMRYLEVYGTDKELRAEVRANLALLKSLELEK